MATILDKTWTDITKISPKHKGYPEYAQEEEVVRRLYETPEKITLSEKKHGAEIKGLNEQVR